MNHSRYYLLVCFSLCVGRAGEFSAFKEPGWVGGLAFSPDDKSLAIACSDGTARLRQIATGMERSFDGHSNSVVAVAFSEDAKRLATGSFDHTARIWNVGTAECQTTLKGHKGAVLTVAFANQGKTLVTGSIDTTIKLWDSRSGSLKTTLSGHKSWVNSVVVRTTASGAERLISGSSDGTIKEWLIPDGKLVRTIDVTSAEVRSITVSSADIAAGIRYGVLKTWHGDHERLNLKAHQGDIWSVVFSPDARYIISGDGDWDNPGEVKIWNAEGGQLIASFGHSAEVLSLACSHNAKLIAAGARDGNVKIWSMP
jgi:WD40 repeat protein